MGGIETKATFDASWRGRSRVGSCEKSALDGMIRQHYLGKWPAVVVCRHALYVDRIAMGCIVWALPPRETCKRYGGVTWELARLWVDDCIPKNVETWLISKAVKLIKREHSEVEVLVSYADPSMGHSGCVYRAANWESDGMTDQERKTSRSDYVDETGKRYSRKGHVPAGVFVSRIPRVSKFRYVYRLKTKRKAQQPVKRIDETRMLTCALVWKVKTCAD
jgi:hypothetical protein